MGVTDPKVGPAVTAPRTATADQGWGDLREPGAPVRGKSLEVAVGDGELEVQFRRLIATGDDGAGGVEEALS